MDDDDPLNRISDPRLREIVENQPPRPIGEFLKMVLGVTPRAPFRVISTVEKFCAESGTTLSEINGVLFEDEAIDEVLCDRLTSHLGLSKGFFMRMQKHAHILPLKRQRDRER